MGRLIWTLICGMWLGAILPFAAQADITATVNADRVNVRARPSLASEVIGQLHPGAAIVVLEAIKLERASAGEPRDWYKILLPTDTTVWVSASHVDQPAKMVKARRLNVRAGPGENYSVVGRLVKHDAVREVRVLDDWMEIEPPPGTYGFVATAFVTLSAPLPGATLEPVAKPAPDTNAAAKPVPSNPPPVPAAPPPPAAKTPVAITPAPPTNPAPTPPVAAAPPVGPTAAKSTPLVERAAAKRPVLPKRIVRREGFLVSTVSIQAPTTYKLKSTDTGKEINYLRPGSPRIQLAPYKRQRVVVTGEEQLDSRWPNLPMIEVTSIELAP